MRTLIPSFLLVLPLALGCTTHTLDGGSNANEPAPADSPANASQDGLDVTTPAGGTVIEQPFSPTAFELRQDTKSPTWSLVVHNGSAACARSTRMGDDVLIVTLSGFGVGTTLSWPLELGDVTFQKGLYDASKVPATESGVGRIRLDGTPGEIGTTVEGRIRVAADTSTLEGAFTATVCAPR